MKSLLAVALFLALPVVASAQHTHGTQHDNHGGRNHGRGDRHEHRNYDEHYRHDHFGREHSVQCHELGWDHGRFFFGGVYFSLTYFPDYWNPYDVVYVDFFDGDYFLYNARLNARVAIVVYE